MWNTLIGLIERWWREKPRLDLVRTVVRLRDAMIDCQSSYEKYEETMKVGDIESLSHQNTKFEWAKNLVVLGNAVAEVDGVLSIFSTEAHSAIRSYLISEGDLNRFLVSAEGTLGRVAKELGQPIEIDIRQVELSSNFLSALTQLDEFIQKNFKIEEVHAAQTSRWR